MKPHLHARSSARRYGGRPEDYLALHEYMDKSKSAHASVAHRAVFHSAFGIFIVGDVFGPVLVNSTGVTVSTRDLAEQHVLEDLHFIPSLDDWLRHLPLQPWMAGRRLPILPGGTPLEADGTAGKVRFLSGQPVVGSLPDPDAEPPEES